MRANTKLRKNTNEVYSNIYFTPDQTKNQRKQAYDLRVERRSREDNGETDLKISRGKIVTVKGKTRDSVDGTRTSEQGAALPPGKALRLLKTSLSVYNFISCTVMLFKTFLMF